MSGPRPGQMGGFRRLFGRALARDLTVFVVPDVHRVAAAGLDLAAAGLRPVSTPRHASVLLLLGDIPGGLAPAVATAYAQMPRPRAIVALGSSGGEGVPPADIEAPASQAALVAVVRDLRGGFASSAWQPEAPPAAPDGAVHRHDEQSTADTHSAFPAMEHGGSAGHAGPAEPAPGHVGHDMPAQSHPDPSGHHTMHRHRNHDAPKSDLAPEPGVSEEPVVDQAAMGHGKTTPPAIDHATMGHSMATHDTMEHGAVDHAAMGHATMGEGHGTMDHSAMGHDMMDHSAHMMGGFMSMVAMTKDVPRSPDGLPMEWIDAPFGPLFPGLPGGLQLTLTLDGDVVVRTAVVAGILTRGLDATWAGPVVGFPDRLARLDPSATAAYRLLAKRALAAAIDGDDERIARSGVGALEWERIASHAGWLAAFASLLGVLPLARRASALQRAIALAGDDLSATRLRQPIDDLVRSTERTPLLRRRLTGIGGSPGADPAHLTGPVAQAAGVAQDARGNDPTYIALGFAPITGANGDALGRLQVRLAALRQSLALVQAAGLIDAAARDSFPVLTRRSGRGSAAVETPRGTATLQVVVDGGVVTDILLETPSTRLAALVPLVSKGAELADALVGIASLDLSPWEIDR